VCKHLHADQLRKYEISVGKVIITPGGCSNIMAELWANQCAIVYESDHDFGDISVIGSTELECKSLSSQKIDPERLKHMASQQRKELLEVINRYPECIFRINVGVVNGFSRRLLERAHRLRI